LPLPSEKWKQESANRTVPDAVKDTYVKKTLKLPAKIAYKAEKAGVNFSKVLREALDDYLKEDKNIRAAP